MKRSQTAALLAVILACLALSAMVAASFYCQERRETLAGFAAEVDALGRLLHEDLCLHLEALYLLKALFDGSTVVDNAEFQRVADETLQRHGDILALGWVPREAQGAAEASFPLHYLAAGPRRSDLLGVDLARVPAIGAVLQAARTQGELQATALLPFFGEEPQLRGMLALLPTYHHGALDGATPTLRGFVIGIVPVGELLASQLWQHPIADIDLTLLDNTADPAQRILYRHQPPSRSSASATAHLAPLPAVAGRQLSLRAQPTDQYLARHTSRVPHLIMLSGFLFTLLLGAYLRMLVVRSAEIEQLVEARTRKLHEANDKLANLSMTDGLTGIANRRNFDSHLEVEWKRGIRQRQPLTLMLIDIDCFKAYNDHYGHLQGDRCLRQVARVLNEQTCRPRDLAARYGGEEFALILPHTDHAAQALGEQCRAAVAALAIPHTASFIAGCVTVSVGIASLLPQRGSQPAELIGRADQALYQAKRSGRNRVMLAP